MSGLSTKECDLIPWYRVVAKNGYISALKLGFKGQIQKDILIKQDYTLNGDFVDMKIHTLTDLTVLNIN
jgi:alkylated DNA nucleotide flippase Atl1